MRIQLSDHFTYSKLVRFTLPSIAMMIFTSIYGVVDGFFISNYAGKSAFAAVNLIMPLLIILATTGFMLGTGGTAIVANTLGLGEKERANRYFSLFVYTAFGLGVVFGLGGLAVLRPAAILLGAKGELLEHCLVYGRIVLLALPAYMLQLLFQTFFVTAERPQLGFLFTLGAGLTNALLDWLLVGYLPQEYKLAGAAIASAAGMAVGGIFPLFYFFRKNTSLLRLGKTRLDLPVLKKACINGSSEFMSNISASLVSILYNVQLLAYAGEDGIAAYGVMMYVSMIFNGTFIGYSMGTAPVIGFHYGAEHWEELKSLLKQSVTLILGFSVAMTGAAQLLARPLALLFVGYDPALVEFTASGFRIFSLAFLFMGYSIFCSGFFTALNDGVISAIVSFFRTLVFQAGAVLLLPRWLGIGGVWASVALAELLSVVMCQFFLERKRKKYHY